MNKTMKERIKSLVFDLIAYTCYVLIGITIASDIPDWKQWVIFFVLLIIGQFFEDKYVKLQTKKYINE